MKIVYVSEIERTSDIMFNICEYSSSNWAYCFVTIFGFNLYLRGRVVVLFILFFIFRSFYSCFFLLLLRYYLEQRKILFSLYTSSPICMSLVLFIYIAWINIGRPSNLINKIFLRDQGLCWTKKKRIFFFFYFIN